MGSWSPAAAEPLQQRRNRSTLQQRRNRSTLQLRRSRPTLQIRRSRSTLQLSRMLAGPLATLGDLGAEVVNVQRSEVGDQTRSWQPPTSNDGQSTYYLAVSRNKRSLTLDLSTSDGCAVAKRLPTRANISVENLTPSRPAPAAQHRPPSDSSPGRRSAARAAARPGLRRDHHNFTELGPFPCPNPTTTENLQRP
jgi:hypothetical protein